MRPVSVVGVAEPALGLSDRAPAHAAAWLGDRATSLEGMGFSLTGLLKLLKDTLCNHLKHGFFHQNKGKPPFTSCTVQVYNVRIAVQLQYPEQSDQPQAIVVSPSGVGPTLSTSPGWPQPKNGQYQYGQGSKPPVNIPIPTKIGSKMGGEFTYQPKWYHWF